MMNWLLTGFYFLVFLFIIRKLKFFSPDNIPFALVAFAFLFKTIAGILLGYVYSHHYKGEGDTFKYLLDGNTLHGILLTNPVDYFRILFGLSSDNDLFRANYFSKMYNWYNNDFDFFFNDSRTIIRINSVIRIFSFGIYNIHSLFFTFFSFAGLTALYRFCSSAIKRNHKIFYAGIFLFPSVAFWGSGLLKEAIVIFALGFILYFALKSFSQKSFLNFFMLLLFTFLLLLLKFYYIIALLPGIAGYLWSRNNENIFLKYFTTHLIWFLLLYSVRFIAPEYKVPVILSAKQSNFINMAYASNAGSIFNTTKLEPLWRDIFKKSPDAILNTLFNPLSFDSGNKLILISTLETIFVLLILMLSLIFFRQPEQNDYPLLLFSLSFVIITFTLIGLTTPVAGALVRYKVITLPFLIFLSVYFIDFDKLKKIVATDSQIK